MCVCVQWLSHGWLLVTPWTIAQQAPLSMEFSTQEYWVGCHFLLQEIFPSQRSSLCLLYWQADSLLLATWKARGCFLTVLHEYSCPTRRRLWWFCSLSSSTYKSVSDWQCKFVGKMLRLLQVQNFVWGPPERRALFFPLLLLVPQHGLRLLTHTAGLSIVALWAAGFSPCCLTTGINTIYLFPSPRLY